MAIRFYTLDVFTDRAFGGNQLAVFPDPGTLPTERMQQIAREFNLSETVFVYPPSDAKALCRLRIFTPSVELPFAGHPTIGTAILLVQLGIAPPAGPDNRFRDGGTGRTDSGLGSHRGEGPVRRALGGTSAQEGPPPPPVADLARLLGLQEDEVLTRGLGPRAFSSGVPFLFVPVRDRAALARARMDTVLWAAGLAGYWAPSVFLFCRDPETPGAHFRARMFAPAMGIVEDPATGGAAAALAGYLTAAERPADGTARWLVEQGVEMGRPSLLQIEADVVRGKTVAVRVGGRAVRMTEGNLNV